MMGSVVGSLMEQLMSGDNLALMSNEVGADEKAVKSTLEMGLPLMLGAMNKNATKPEGINAIMNGLGQVSNNNPIDDMSSYLGSPGSFQGLGSGMLDTMLGSFLQPVQQSISKKTGLPPAVVNKTLSIALPLVLGSLSKSSANRDIMGEKDFSKFLGDQSKTAMSSSPDAANVMKEVLTTEQSDGGLMGLIKKLIRS